MAGQEEEAYPFVWGPRKMFLGFLPEGERSVGENVARYFELWRTVEGGGLSEFGAARRLIDHLLPRRDEWALVLLSDMMEEDFYTNRHVDFTLFVSRIITHWLQNQNGPVFPPLPPPPPPAPSSIPFHHPLTHAPPPSAPIPFHFPVAPAPSPPSHPFDIPPPPSYPPSAVPPPPSSSPPLGPYPLHGPWDSTPMNIDPFLQPLYDHHPWVLDSIPHGQYYYFLAPVPISVYPPPPQPRHPRCPLHHRTHPEARWRSRRNRWKAQVIAPLSTSSLDLRILHPISIVTSLLY